MTGQGHHMQHQVDVALAGGAMTSPVWLQLFETIAQYYLIIGGVVLLTLRILIAAIEFHQKRKNKA